MFSSAGAAATGWFCQGGAQCCGASGAESGCAQARFTWTAPGRNRAVVKPSKRCVMLTGTASQLRVSLGWRRLLRGSTADGQSAAGPGNHHTGGLGPRGSASAPLLLHPQGNVLLETKSQQQQIVCAVGNGPLWQRALGSQGRQAAARGKSPLEELKPGRHQWLRYKRHPPSWAMVMKENPIPLEAAPRPLLLLEACL